MSDLVFVIVVMALVWWYFPGTELVSAWDAAKAVSGIVEKTLQDVAETLPTASMKRVLCVSTATGELSVEMVGVLGRGAYGQVYSVVYRYGGGPYRQGALKRSLKMTEMALAEWEVEVSNLRRFRGHVHVIQLLEAFKVGNERYMLCGLGGGVDLTTHVTDVYPRRQLPLTEALLVAWQVATALHKFHTEGYVHLDLKPDNIVLAGSELVSGVVVVDLGLMRKVVDMSEGGRTWCGTPGYVAPETACRGVAYPASDVWALGIILVELLIGQRLLEVYDGFLKQMMKAVERGHYWDNIETEASWIALPSTVKALLKDLCAHDHTQRPTGSLLVQRLRTALMDSGFCEKRRVSYTPRPLVPLRSATAWSAASSSSFETASGGESAFGTAPINDSPSSLDHEKLVSLSEMLLSPDETSTEVPLVQGTEWLDRFEWGTCCPPPVFVKGEVAGEAPPPADYRFSESPSEPDLVHVHAPVGVLEPVQAQAPQKKGMRKVAKAVKRRMGKLALKIRRK